MFSILHRFKAHVFLFTARTMNYVGDKRMCSGENYHLNSLKASPDIVRHVVQFKGESEPIYL